MSGDAGARPGWRGRVAAALAVATAAALLAAFDAVTQPGVRTDFDQSWFAATVVRQGGDPYALIGPGRQFDWVFPYFYPLSAALLLLPLSLLPLVAARALFIAIPAGVLAYLLTRDSYWRLALFASGAFVSAAKWAQWSPALACAVLAPGLGFLAAVKPNFGLMLAASARDRASFLKVVAGGALLAALSVAVQPGWPARYLEVLRSGGGAFVWFLRYPEGWLLLLALARWRRADARLLLAHAPP